MSAVFGNHVRRSGSRFYDIANNPSGIDVSASNVQELTGMKDHRNPITILCNGKSPTRWKSYRNTLLFIDACLPPENKRGEIICVSTDVAKARNNQQNIYSDVNYVYVERNVLNSEDVIKRAIVCMMNLFPKADVIFFENVCAVNTTIPISDMIQFVKKYLPISVKAVFTTPVYNNTESMTELDTILLDVHDTKIYVNRSLSKMTDFTFITSGI